ncbi:MAG TPA: hypothetical protein VFG52_04515, partial [Xanthomonadales bacterium]|nr:hypothetical protein [Xanthomonadales bacterium]
YVKADRSWITISGEVESVSADSFVLNYDSGKVVVEMDDGDRDADAYKLLAGDKVTVSGRIDDDFLETTTIEAFSVYLKSLDTTFFASSADEEGPDPYAVNIIAPLVANHYNLIGTVSKVQDEEFVVDTGARSLTVEVDEMAYNPLDDEGYQKIEVGDRVSVAGSLDYDFFEGRELEADSIVELTYSNS